MKGEDLTVLEQTTQKTHSYLTSDRTRGYPHLLIEKVTMEVKFAERKSALLQNNKVWKKILPFVQLQGNPANYNKYVGDQEWRSACESSRLSPMLAWVSVLSSPFS